jgi:hypothetical protein
MVDGASDKAPDGSARTTSEFMWKGAHALRRVHVLNERCLEVLAQLARTERARLNLTIISQHRNLWRSLSVAERKRAALMPYLLVDVHFQDVDWWRWAKAPRAGSRHSVVSQPVFTGKVAAELMRETLMLAWSTVVLDPGIAGVLLGMTPAVREIVAGLAPQDAERITARHSRHLRPRWEDFPAFWGGLLTAAQKSDEEALHEVRLHGMQLIGSELLPRLDGRLMSPLPQHLKELSTRRDR